jgi:Spy/CpxP family protein refolding chaperone
MGHMGPMGHMGAMGPMGFLMGRAARQLGLTEAQQQKIHSVVQAHAEEMKAFGPKMEAAREALHAAVTAGLADEAALRDIRAKSGAVAAVEADMAVAHAKLRAEALQVLTPEQRAQAKLLETQMRERMQRMSGRMQGWGRHGGRRHHGWGAGRGDQERDWDDRGRF